MAAQAPPASSCPAGRQPSPPPAAHCGHRWNAPGRLTSGMLLVQATGDNGVTGSSSTRLTRRAEPDLREKISHHHLARDIIGLVGG